MAQINLGRVLPKWRGSWNSTVTYEKFDIVYHNGSSYIATGAANNIGQEPNYKKDTEFWVKMCKEGSFEGLSEEQLTQCRLDLRIGVFEIGTNTYND